MGLERKAEKEAQIQTRSKARNLTDPLHSPGKTELTTGELSYGQVDATQLPLASQLLQAQRTLGNRYANIIANGSLSPDQLMPVVQTKLKVGKPNDKYEKEADRVARVVIQRLTQKQTNQENTIRRQAVSSLQYNSHEQGLPASPKIEAAVQQARRGGRRLPKGIRRSMEGELGADLADVRIYINKQADLLNEQLQSRAFTIGPEIYFRTEDYNPQSQSGQTILAHELVHVVQQSKIDTSPKPKQQEKTVSSEFSDLSSQTSLQPASTISNASNPNSSVLQRYLIDVDTPLFEKRWQFDVPTSESDYKNAVAILKFADFSAIQWAALYDAINESKIPPAVTPLNNRWRNEILAWIREKRETGN